ncbi:MAG: Xaa-Pro aminopeptidase [Gammaproteobacteria bacterium]|jgi:Xaa-Pro aminopeptidase|nr:Xaa-Pro aminopeptidase [Gammaproteobacteria bacterium]
MNISDKLSSLRTAMRQIGADFYYVPSGDAHQNEYVPGHWQRRAWISGFTGSAGDVLVGMDQAYLWTDPRYFLQAENQLDKKHYQLMTEQVQGFAPPIDIWLKKNAMHKVCAVDPRVITIAQTKKFKQALESVDGKLLAVDSNLIDGIWSKKPEVKTAPLSVYDSKYSGMTAREKLQLLRDAIKQLGADSHVLSMLDAIAWLFNIRGSDVDFNPLVISYALITQTEATLFVDLAKVKPEDQAYFAEQGIKLREYHEVQTVLNQLKAKVLLDPSTASWWIEQQLINATVILDQSPITMMKACKNPVEQEGAKEAHRRDGRAVVRFLSWLDQHWQEGHTEISLANKLEAFRKQEPDYVSLSFNTISGFAGHGAIVHYAVSPESDVKVDDSAIYLLDSGGQYLQGTTDITRVIHLGKPTEQEKHYYTLVLKGHLALRHTPFPAGTRGEHVDALARAALWKEALNYGHGTGHGVGAFLCVHEGPQRISQGASGVALRPGMIVSNEPGLYIAGQYGLRIENLCIINTVFTENQSLSRSGPFYGLEDLTMVPYNRKLINKAELRAEEILWVDAYHQKIFQCHKDSLSPEELAWLKAATAPL